MAHAGVQCTIRFALWRTVLVKDWRRTMVIRADAVTQAVKGFQR